MEELHDKFVLVPIDKASGNIAFVCKRFYAQVIVNELGLRDPSGTLTYKTVTDKSPNAIIDKHTKFLLKKFGINKPNSTDKVRLPNIYWIPKMHKTPIKYRFIIASPDSSIKPLSRAIASIFRLLQSQIESYNTKCRFFSGVNTFWVILNNDALTKSIKRLNKRGKGKSIYTYDFSTLYTKIPHDKLLSVLSTLVDFCFKGGTSEYIYVNDYGARWVSNPSTYGFVFGKSDIKLALRYLMSNCYFTFGDWVFQQIIGIPMGSDPAPFFANLFLYFYESTWLRQIQKTDIARARRFSNTFRFIDDLSTLNDGGEFSRSYHEIYPPELELGRENVDTSYASFLDLSIRIQNGKFITSLFDKRDNFPFNIVRMPFSSSNMPSKIFYSSIGAEILRIARTTTKTDDFINSGKMILQRMVKQGADSSRTKKTLCKTIDKYNKTFSHLFSSTMEAIQSLI